MQTLAQPSETARGGNETPSRSFAKGECARRLKNKKEMGMRSIFYDFKANVDLELPSRKRLYQRLGEYDTLAEYSVCAIRDFESNWDNSVPFTDYVTSKAREHNVNLKGGVMLPNHEPALYKSFIVNSHSLLGDFIQHYRNDIRNLFEPTFKLGSEDGQSAIERLLRPLSKIGINPQFPEWLLPSLEYYRLVRNSTAHYIEDEDACIKAFGKISIEMINEQYPVFENRAPNRPANLTVDDFYFYSACIKHFANYLTMAIKGKVDWSNIAMTHEALDVTKIKKGTNTLSLISSTFMLYKHKPTKEEFEAARIYIHEQKDLLKNKR